MDRASLSFMGDAENIQERMNAFRNRYPEGDVIQVERDASLQGQGAGQVLAGRRNPNEKYGLLDPGPATGATRAEQMADLPGDIGDILGSEVAPLLGEMGAFALTQGKSLFGQGIGRRLATQAVTQGTGAIAAESARQGVQELAGTNLESVDEIKWAGIEASAGATVAEVLVGALRVGKNAIKQTPNRTFIDEATEAGTEGAEIAERRGLPDMLAGQASGKRSLLNRMTSMMSNFSGKLRRYLDSQLYALEAMARGSVDPAVHARAFGRAKEMATRIATEAQHSLSGLLRGGHRLGADEVGDIVAGLSEAYVRGQQLVVSEAYRVFEHLAPGVRFGSGRIRNSFTEVEERIRLGYRSQAAPDADSALDLADDLADAPPVPVYSEGGGDIVSLLTKLRDVDDYSLREIMNLRREVQKLTVPGADGVVRLEQSAAKPLFDAIDGTLDDGLESLDVGAREVLKAARELASERFTFSEALRLQGLMVPTGQITHPNAFAIGERLISSSAGDPLRVVSQLPPAALDAAHDLFISRAILDPERGIEILDALQPEVRKLLLRGDEQLVRKALKDVELLKQTHIPRLLETELKSGPWSAALTQGNSVQIDALGQLVAKYGGKEGALGTSVRTSIMQNLLERSSKYNPMTGKFTLDAKNFAETLKNFEERGLFKLLTDDNLRLAQDAKKFAFAIELGSDPAAALVRGNTVAMMSGEAAARLTGFSVMGAILSSGRLARAVEVHSLRAAQGGIGGVTSDPKRAASLMGAMTATITESSEGLEIAETLQDVIAGSLGFLVERSGARAPEQ